MKVAEVMTTDVVAVRPTTPYEAVARLLVDKQLGAVPVVEDGGRLVGIVSEADLLQRHDAVIAVDVMSSTVQTATPEESVWSVADRMRRKRLRRLPVVADGKLVGIVSRHDVLSGIADPGSATRTLTPAETAGEPDAEAVPGDYADWRDMLFVELESGG